MRQVFNLNDGREATTRHVWSVHPIPMLDLM